ncbi:MAG: DUF488 family protein [Thermoactinomyces sp.]
MPHEIRLKRIYESPEPEDGKRILVDRLWPRGMKKEMAVLDEWMKEIAPSPELRKSFNHKPERFKEFKMHYERELAADPVRRQLLDRICSYLEESPVTILYAAKDPVHNHAAVLRDWINKKIREEKENG